MAQIKFGSAGVTAREIDISGVVTQEPAGVPAGVIGTAQKGPAFVPVTVGVVEDFNKKFGPSDGEKFGPLAAGEWLRNATSLTYTRVLGVGDGKQRVADGQLGGSVNGAGFVVGERQPLAINDGLISANPYANLGGAEGRTYFLGAFMSEAQGSTVFSDSNLQVANSGVAAPILRGVLMAPSGVIPRLSSVAVSSTKPASTLVADDATAQGDLLGSVTLLENNTPKQEFVVLLNGHKGTDALYPNVITASFDMTANNYFAKVLNTDPYKLQQAGHYLYANWDVHPALANVTGSGLVVAASGSGAGGAGTETAAFLTTSSLGRNVGSDSVPNYELFADRFSAAKSPWITSQKFGGQPINLFRFHAIDHGAGVSVLYKISIENIVVSTDLSDLYGSFDVVLRQWNDRDTAQLPLERFSGVNLNPNSDRYIAKIIGDANVYYDFDRIESSQRLMVEGNYSNRSNYVRVEVNPSIENENIPPEALPIGFRGIAHLNTSGSAPMTSPVSGTAATQLSVANVLKNVTTPALQFRKTVAIGSGSKKSAEPQYYWGVQFEHITSIGTPNASTLANDSMKSFAKYFADFSTTNVNFVAGDNAGEADSATNGIVDSDKFCLNAFSLENVQVVTGASGVADNSQWKNAVYVRNGNIVVDDTNKTRAFQISDLIQANRKFAKFSLFMQGGFDGVNIFDEDEQKLTNTAATADIEDVNRGQNNGPTVKAYAKALEVMQNLTNADIQLLAMPGIRHSYLTNLALTAVENRFDALYIMDLEQFDGNNSMVTSSVQLPSVEYTTQAARDRSLNSSFGAAYFPDVVMTDPTVKTNVVVPPSVAVLGALATNDSVAHPWFAPAGTTRGALSTTLEARVKLSKSDMDQLYDININPLVAFPGNATVGTNPKGGVVVWGQKTLLSTASALDRVNVRRLLIDIRRQIRDISNFIVFEPSRESTLAKFTEMITPRLQRIQNLSGVDKFKIVIDSSTTTQADILNNTLRGVIYVQPRKAIEFVSLDFVVTNAGAQI